MIININCHGPYGSPSNFIFVQSRRINDSSTFNFVHIGNGSCLPVCWRRLFLHQRRQINRVNADYPQSALDSLYSSIEYICFIIIIVSYIVFLYAVTGKDISEAPSTIYAFIGAGSLVFAALHVIGFEGHGSLATRQFSRYRLQSSLWRRRWRFSNSICQSSR